MDTIILDIIKYICHYASDKDKIQFLSVNQKMHLLKNFVNYWDMIRVEKIQKLWYFDRFINIIVDKTCTFPKNVKCLTFGWYFNQEIKDCIPLSVTHLTFGSNFNQDIKDCIPLSVTHLTFGWNFNQDIKDCIPSSVTHLIFGACFNKDIKDCIPSSVTHLTFGGCFNQDIKDCIPSSVTHLTFGYYFNQDFDFCSLPNLIVLKLSVKYQKYVDIEKPCRISMHDKLIEFNF